MGIKLRANPKFQQLDGNGDPLAGGKVYTYEPGTTTDKATYTDNAKTATNDNPVILNARGEADIWWDGAYKVVVKDANDVTIYTVDNYGAGEDVAIYSAGNWITNGSFESDTDGDGIPDNWTITEYDATSTVELDDTTQEHGEVSLKFVSTGLGGGIAETSFFEVGKSETLYLTFKYKSSVVDVRNVVEISWYTSAKSLISATTLLDESAANPTSFTKQTYQPAAPATAAFAKFKFYGCHSSDATAGTTWLDDVYINWYPIIDEDDMVSDSTNHIPTQQSVKAYVDNLQGVILGNSSYPVFSAIQFDVVSSITHATWESVGPTDSGADNIWTALNLVPLDADWIVIKLRMIGSVVGYGGPDGTGINAQISARPHGSIVTTGGQIVVGEIYDATTNTNAFASNINTPLLPLDAGNIFDLYHLSATFVTSRTFTIDLLGYGYN